VRFPIREEFRQVGFGRPANTSRQFRRDLLEWNAIEKDERPSQRFCQLSHTAALRLEGPHLPASRRLNDTQRFRNRSYGAFQALKSPLLLLT
jgi:hypothetical protein